MKDQSRFHRRNRPLPGPDDYMRRRRQRRMQRTPRSEATVRSWAEQHGFGLRVLKGGHHWILKKPGMFAEWWPSSAMPALNRDYLRTFHAPHWSDIIAALEHSSTSETSAYRNRDSNRV